MSKKCTVEGCNNKYFAKSYCQKHYMQWRKYGKILDRTKYDTNEIIEHDDYAEIILYNKQGDEVARTLIDSDNIEKCKQYKWRLNDNGYVLADIKGTAKKIRLHRYLMDCPSDLVVDHINHNRLDNRISNLRICTQQQNIMNHSISSNNSSGATGVCFDSSKNKWLARITLNGKTKHLGYFKTKEEAIEARKQAEIKYFGEFSPNTQD